MDNDKYRTDRLDTRMDSTEGEGRRMKEPIDLQATLRRHSPINMFVTPGIVRNFGPH